MLVPGLGLPFSFTLVETQHHVRMFRLTILMMDKYKVTFLSGEE